MVVPATWAKILETVNRYPSPHNSQPIKVRPTGELTATIYYDLDLGLPAGSGKMPFEHGTAGIFLEALHVVAAGYGYEVQEDLHITEIDFEAADRLHLIGYVTLNPAPITQEATRWLHLFNIRKTSRLPYQDKEIPAAVLAELGQSTKPYGTEFGYIHDPKRIKQIVRANQATLFEYMQTPEIHEELLLWLRFDERTAAATRDGLSAKAMHVPGRIMGFAMRNPKLWDTPVFGNILKATYLRTTQGVHYLGWLECKFKTAAEAVDGGRAFMRIWLVMTAHGLYLHPFGTVITNKTAHDIFIQQVGIEENETNTAWMLFRFGNSKQPPTAYRRDYTAMILEGN